MSGPTSKGDSLTHMAYPRPVLTPEEFATLGRVRRPILATGTEHRVCEDIARRQALGVAKYGTTVEQNPLTTRQWLQHAYEEALDLAIYLKRSMEEIDKTNPQPPTNEIIPPNRPARSV